MRQLNVDPTNPDHMNGPYLVFARSHPAFSDYHDFQDWDFLGSSLIGKMWGKNAVLALVNRPSEFSKAGDIPDWIELFEVASVSAEFGVAAFASDPTGWDDEGEYFVSSSRNLTQIINPGTTPEKRSFDRRLLIVSYEEELSDRHISRQNDRIRSCLGRSSVCVWHSEDLFGFAFKDSRTPQEIVNALSGVIHEDRVLDCAVFKVAAVLCEPGTPSPLAHFLSPDGR